VLARLLGQHPCHLHQESGRRTRVIGPDKPDLRHDFGVVMPGEDNRLARRAAETAQDILHRQRAERGRRGEVVFRDFAPDRLQVIQDNRLLPPHPRRSRSPRAKLHHPLGELVSGRARKLRSRRWRNGHQRQDHPKPVGRTPWSAADALVRQPTRYRRRAVHIYPSVKFRDRSNRSNHGKIKAGAATTIAAATNHTPRKNCGAFSKRRDSKRKNPPTG
jgi:hypothetical protein